MRVDELQVRELYELDSFLFFFIIITISRQDFSV